MLGKIEIGKYTGTLQATSQYRTAGSLKNSCHVFLEACTPFTIATVVQ